MGSHVLTMMVFKLLLYLSSPFFSSDFLFFVFDVKHLLKSKFVVYYVMTKMGANE